MLLTQVVEAETEEERELALDPVQQLVNFVQFANDEGDPGMGLELGMALFCHGGQVASRSLLVVNQYRNSNKSGSSSYAETPSQCGL